MRISRVTSFISSYAIIVLLAISKKGIEREGERERKKTCFYEARVNPRHILPRLPPLRLLSRSVISPSVRRESRGRLLISIKGIADWIKSTLPWQAGSFCGITSVVFFIPRFSSVSFPPLVFPEVWRNIISLLVDRTHKRKSNYIFYLIL